MGKLNFFDYVCIFYYDYKVKNNIKKYLPFNPGASTCAEIKQNFNKIFAFWNEMKEYKNNK